MAYLATRGGQHCFDVEVYLGGLDPEAVRVELCSAAVDGNGFEAQQMKQVDTAPSPSGSFTYRVAVPAARPARDYTARLIPRCAVVAVPLEDARILWQR
jgi:starch phosphorylase